MKRPESILASLERAGKWGEDALLVLILTTMILLAAAQIVLRNFFQSGITWGDGFLQVLVLWAGMIGALAASRSDRHISIDVLNRFLPKPVSRAVKVVIHVFTAGVCGVVAWHALQFVKTSYEFEDVLLGTVPAWILQAVLPVGFGLIAWRYALFAVRDVAGLFRAGQPE